MVEESVERWVRRAAALGTLGSLHLISGRRDGRQQVKNLFQRQDLSDCETISIESVAAEPK